MPIATLITLVGQAWARDAEDNLRELSVGDVLVEGETLITANNARVELDFGDGIDPTVIEGARQIVMTPELSADQDVAVEDASGLDEDLEALLAALDDDDVDLLDIFDATAAGAGGAGGGGGGSSFVRLGRVSLDTDQLGFGFAGPSADDTELPELEAFAGVGVEEPSAENQPNPVPAGDDGEGEDDDTGEDDTGDDGNNGEQPEQPEAIISAVAAHTSGNGGGEGNTGTYANNGNGGRLKDGAMDGSGSTGGVRVDGDGFYSVDHQGSGNNDNPNMIDGNEAILFQFAHSLTKITFEVEGGTDGATYSLFDADGNRIGGPSEMEVNGEGFFVFEDEDNATVFNYIAFDGSASDGSEFKVKPIGYTTEEGYSYLIGNEDVNNVLGGGGDDVLAGSEGNDALTGGAGADTFVWNFGEEGDQGTSGSSEDVVLDFSTDEGDELSFTELLNGVPDDEQVNYIRAEDTDEGVMLHISTSGTLSVDENDNISGSDQTILLSGVEYSGTLLDDLISDGNINIE